MTKSIEEQLSDIGMRLATVNESGWYVIVWSNNDPIKVWATNI